MSNPKLWEKKDASGWTPVFHRVQHREKLLGAERDMSGHVHVGLNEVVGFAVRFNQRTVDRLVAGWQKIVVNSMHGKDRPSRIAVWAIVLPLKTAGALG